ncbi:MAG: hypothetical protein Tsb002_06270 [Wenzhouxiangellaceae bacterium]
MPELGFFDWLNPLLNTIDAPLSRWLPVWLRLLFWSVLTAALPWLLFRLLWSRPRALAARRELGFHLQMRKTFGAMGVGLKGNRRKAAWQGFKLLLYAGIPLLLAMILFIMLFGWLPRQYAYHPPAASEWTQLAPLPLRAAEPQLRPRPVEQVSWSGDLQAWVVRWPYGKQQIEFRTQQGEMAFQLRSAAMGPRLTPRRWWHALYANQAGYLSPAAGVEAVSIRLQPLRFIDSGPPWLGAWWQMPLLLLLLAALFWWRR